MQWRSRSRRASTGRQLNKNTKKKRRMRGRDFLPMHIGATRSSVKRTRGGGEKFILMAGDVANISEKGKVVKAKITSVLQSPSDPQYVRRNVITKGAVIATELGEARVTSRPGQDGVVNAVLLKRK